MVNCRFVPSKTFGTIAIIWVDLDGRPKIKRVLLSRPEATAETTLSELYSDVQKSSCSQIDGVAIGIKALLWGEFMEFSLDLVDLDECSDFQKSVLIAEHRIPRGFVSTYNLIANHVGKKNGARAVGNALAENPFPLIVPCHRAIRSDLHLGGYQGGVEMKRALLKDEGVKFDDKGRVVTRLLFYGRKF